jgi:hypothetical protein
MLHVLNGDATATVFAAAGLPGNVLVWRDILVEGPLWPEWPTPDMLALRTAFLAERLAIDPERYRLSVREQDEGLAGALRHDEIVLWFEQDLFCAVNLWYVLAWFARGPTAARLTLVYPPVDEVKGLGVRAPAQLAALFTVRSLITPHALALGRRAWEAYTDRDLRAAATLAETETDALPFVRDAFRLHCARFPSVVTGLSEVETATLASLERDSMRFGELFRAVTADSRGARHGMGDVQFVACLRGLVPLVSMSGDDVTSAAIALTALGREVLAGHRDWPSVRALDVWLGGVHLEGDRPRWRWDGARRQPVESTGNA